MCNDLVLYLYIYLLSLTLYILSFSLYVIGTFGDGSTTQVPQRLQNWKYIDENDAQ
jgi:hypothetical protein